MKRITEHTRGKEYKVRASWKGYLRIGNLTTPVRLYSATRSAAPRFVQLHTTDHAPIRRVSVCAIDGEQLTEDDIVRAVEHEGKYIEMNDRELERHSGLERDIIVRQITTASEIDPVYYDNPYYLVPDKGGELSYTILRQAFEKTGKVAIATFLFYGRERLSVVTSREGLLTLQVLRFHDEIVPRSKLPSPALPQPSPSQIALASRLFEHYSMPFHASDYRDQQADILNELIDRKSKNLPLKTYKRIPTSTTPEDQVVTTMERMLGESPDGLSG